MGYTKSKHLNPLITNEYRRINMKMQEVKSSNIAAVGHAFDILFVEFKNGSTYRYNGVTEEQFNKLLSAGSIGKHLNSMGVKGTRI